MTAAERARYVAAVVARAPEPTPETRERVTFALRPGARAARGGERR